MNLKDLMAVYSHGRRIYQIIQGLDPSHTTRKYPKQKDLIKKMSDEELDELCRYIETVDNLICRFAEQHELKLEVKDAAQS